MADSTTKEVQIGSSAPVVTVQIPTTVPATDLQASANANKMPEEDKTLINPLDIKEPQKSEDSDLIKNIVSAETVDQRAILGEAPILDTSLLTGMVPQKSVTLTALKLTFGFLLLASVVSVLFFTSQLTNTFDFIAKKLGIPNISQELASTNSEIIKLQTDLNTYRYLEVKALLDQFSFDGDNYLKHFDTANSQTASENEKLFAIEEMDNAKGKLRSSFMSLREKLAIKFSVPLIDTNFTDEMQLEALFTEGLRTRLTQKASELVNSDSAETRRDYKNYSQAVNLVDNNDLRNLVMQTDFDSLASEQLYKMIEKTNSLIVNDLSIIQSIKSKRIKWSDIINEIELRTIAVDSYYDENFYNDIGGIRYNSYDFDSGQRKITISGETKRFDTTNFTIIANLIDELNRSDLFENGEMRSFSKSGSLDEGYTATLQLSLNLQDDKPAAADEILSIDAPPTL